MLAGFQTPMLPLLELFTNSSRLRLHEPALAPKKVPLISRQLNKNVVIDLRRTQIIDLRWHAPHNLLMVKRLDPKLDILPAAQRRLWGELHAVPEPFVLYGGTAIALHLGHRESEDFDFFADTNIDVDALYRSIPFLQGATIVQREPDTLDCIVDRGGPVKVSFLGVPNLRRIRAPHMCPDNRLRVADLFDLAGTKANVVQARAQRKDYLDIDALIEAGIDLPTQLAAARQVYGPTFPPTETLKALSYFGDGDLPLLPEDVKRRLVEAAAAVDPLRLPSLKRTARRQPDRDRDR